MEEVARFILNDPRLTTELKDLRHYFSPKDPSLKSVYLDARDAAMDIGPAVMINSEEPARSISQALTANARRTEESLRVLEELAKTEGTGLDGAKLQSARFAVYTLEKTLLGRLMRQDKIALICGLHAVVDTASLGPRLPAEIACEMLRGGARVIQLRDKFTPKRKLVEIALEIAGLCYEYHALFIINDFLDIALAVDADGLHLGQDGLPIRVARKFMPLNRLIGCSVRSVVEAKQAHDEGADYLGYGAVFATNTKAEIHDLGCTILAQIKHEVGTPLVATGGITPYNVTKALHAGADGIVVASAITDATSTEAATRAFIKAMEVYHESSQ